MPKYRVELLKTVHDLLDATVEVEADSPEEAEEKALAMANTVGNTIEFDYHDSLGDGGIETNGATEIAND